MNWLKRIRGAVGMGVVWAALWAAVGAVKALLDPHGSIDAPWVGPPIGVFPGLVGGLLFSAGLVIAAPRRLHELSVWRVAAWGAMVGFFLGVLPFAINEPPVEFPLWRVAAVVIGSMTLMGAVSAAGSLALARRVKGRAPIAQPDTHHAR